MSNERPPRTPRTTAAARDRPAVREPTPTPPAQPGAGSSPLEPGAGSSPLQPGAVSSRSPEGGSSRASARASRLVSELLDLTEAKGNRDILRDLLGTAMGLGDGTPTRLDLKIARAALSEMSDAFRIFAPFRGIPKLTIFGSASRRGK
ncbi:MAG: hypothetical protein ACRDZ5_07190 [Acidimicrobiales bacterium]